MHVRAAFYRPASNEPYAQVYRPQNQPPEGACVILGGTLSLVRPNFPDVGTLRLSAPLAFTAGDWVRVWLGPERAEPDYLGQIVTEPWAEGSGEVEMRSIFERVKTSRWVGKAEGDFQTFLGQVLEQASLPIGVTKAPLPAINARFKANTPHELLGDTFAAITPALGGYQIGVDTQGRLNAVKPKRAVTHRFMLGQSEMPQGDYTNYANCVRFGFEMPSGDTGWFEGRNEPEVAKQGEVWHEEQLTAREAGLPDEPLAGTTARLTRTILVGGYSDVLLNHTTEVPLDTAALGAMPDEPLTVTVVGGGTTEYKDEGDYEWPDPSDRLLKGGKEPGDSQTLAYYWHDAPTEVQYNAKYDTFNSLRVRFNLPTRKVAQRLYDEYWATHPEPDNFSRDDVRPLSSFARSIAVRLHVELPVASDFPPDEALMLSWVYEGFSWPAYACFSPDFTQWGGGWGVGIKAEDWEAAEGKKTCPVMVFLPNEMQKIGNSETLVVDDFIDKVEQIQIGYTPAYRNHLRGLGYGTPEKPLPALRLHRGGAVGCYLGYRSRSEEADKWEYWYPLDVIDDNTATKTIFTHRFAGQESMERRWVDFPALSGEAGESVADWIHHKTRVAPSVLLELPDPLNLPAGSAIVVGTTGNASMSDVLVMPDVADLAAVQATVNEVSEQRLPLADEVYLHVTTTDAKAEAKAAENEPPAQLGWTPPKGKKQRETGVLFAVRGEDKVAHTLVLRGVGSVTTGVRLQTPQLEGVQTYAAELLRYKSQPVRDWRGFYPALQRLEADGTAAFERPHSTEDELLDVQRVTYDLTEWTAEVQAGTPLPATDEDAVAGVVESLRRVQRRADIGGNQ